jgi:hypothetical protein
MPYKLTPQPGMYQPEIAELNGQGFPDYMIDAFMKASKQTKTVVSSRLPGDAGLDLIEEVYDLKGFHIKAKSCNWGPMAGFICKLPFFNKYGFEKVDENAKSILHYLHALHNFSAIKEEINVLDTKIKTGLLPRGLTADEVLRFLKDDSSLAYRNKSKEVFTDGLITVKLSVTTEPVKTELLVKAHLIFDTAEKIDAAKKKDPSNVVDQSALEKMLDDIYRDSLQRKIVHIIKTYQAKEQESGKWSGENSIEQPSPFVNLSRKFVSKADGTIEKVKAMRGIVPGSVKGIADDKVYGLARNVTDETIRFEDNKSTIYTEFLLVRQGDTDIWDICHGDIFYVKDKATSEAPEPAKIKYEVPKIISAATNLPEAVKNVLDLFTKTNEEYPLSVKLNSANLTKTLALGEFLKKVTIDETQAPFVKGPKNFYAIQGFVNAHPPYEGKGDYYKNAVSGDYDLMAYWPNRSISSDELRRMSEIVMKCSLKSNLFSDSSLIVEFIPGFKELNPTVDLPVLKESAESGNVNNLGNLVTGLLNANSDHIQREYIKGSRGSGGIFMRLYKLPVANKAFHSDEGGRPGILEIEFPIAVFFPDILNSVALNNLYTGEKKTVIPPFADRMAKNVLGGLIKTPEELLLLMLEVISHPNKYTVILHSEWLCHLFYLTLDTNQKETFMIPESKLFSDTEIKKDDGSLIPVFIDGSQNFNPDRFKIIKKKLEDFGKIDINHKKIYPVPETFNRAGFEANLRKLFKMEGSGNDEKFKATRNQFLKLAFQSNHKAIERRASTVTVINGEV